VSINSKRGLHVPEPLHSDDESLQKRQIRERELPSALLKRTSSIKRSDDESPAATFRNVYMWPVTYNLIKVTTISSCGRLSPHRHLRILGDMLDVLKTGMEM